MSAGVPDQSDHSDLQGKKIAATMHAFSFLIKPVRLYDLKEQVQECIRDIPKKGRGTELIFEKDIYYFKGVFEVLVKRVEDLGFAINCRGSIVNLRHIVRIKGYSIYLDNGRELSLTQKRAAAFKKKMNAYIQ